MSSGELITVLVADDHPVFREGVAAIIGTQSDMHLIAEASTGVEAVRAHALVRPEITLLDIQMPGMSGIEAALAIRAAAPTAKIIILTTFGGDFQAIQAVKAGVHGYLIKNTLRKELLSTIRAVHAGQRCVPADVSMAMAQQTDADVLSKRELEILAGASRGLGNRAIATHCNISEETVKTHMGKILAKLRANDRTHAVAIAIKRGLLSM